MHDALKDSTEETNLQTFIRALYAAYFASRDVDYFDLRSEDPVSVQKWEGLLASQREAFRTLHAVCRRVPVEELLD